MKRKVFQVKTNKNEEIAAAADVLRSGGLVAFPTETVYGLGADASNAQAVNRIFIAKGRPTDHPLIVHIGKKENLNVWSSNIPSRAWLLAEHFWPGPLTLILRKADWVPEVVTGGLNTIGLRVPAHPLALSLLKSLGGGIAAPSANRFGRVSPTTSNHVREELGDCVDFILDGGACSVGIESTIVDLSSGSPVILRPGGVTQESLEEVLGEPVVQRKNSKVRCSGRHSVHYSPDVRVVLAEEEKVDEVISRFLSDNFRVGLMSSKRLSKKINDVTFIDLAATIKDQAQQLYAKLRMADTLNLDILVVVPPVGSGLEVAINDRLVRAAGQRDEKLRKDIL